MECADCHNSHGTVADKLVDAQTINAKCFECHAQLRGPFLWEHPPVTEDCLTCHTPHGSTHSGLLKAKVPFLCQRCHANVGHPGELAARSSADAKVNTTLYQLRLTSRPWSSMRIKAHLRYCDYDNRTKRIDFTNGYVETDEFLTGTAITNLPTSYTKTRAGLDLGFDLPARTAFGIGYTFERTERENREVDQQDDNVYRASLDNKSLDWLVLRASYERTDRKIGTYNFDVYLRSGDDLNDLPQMRKYDQADLTRDRYQVQATVYPTQALALTGALTFGRDDFKDSPYGLLEDNHLIASFDTDYAVNERTSLNMFYAFETYNNKQRGSDAGADWTATGEDQVNTLGGGVTLKLIPKRLDFDLTYSYSKADGDITFTSSSGSFADFKAVDDAQTHA